MYERSCSCLLTESVGLFELFSIGPLMGAGTLMGPVRVCGACVEPPLNGFDGDVGGEEVAD